MVYWNNTYVYDEWYRKHYKIPYGSDAHLSTKLSDLKFMWLEWKRMKLNEWRRDLEENIRLITKGKYKNVSDYIQFNSKSPKINKQLEDHLFLQRVMNMDKEKEKQKA